MEMGNIGGMDNDYWVPLDPTGQNGLNRDRTVYFGQKLYGDMSDSERAELSDRGILLEWVVGRKRDDFRRIQLIDQMRTQSAQEIETKQKIKQMRSSALAEFALPGG